MEKVVLTLTEKDVQTIYSALAELPAKISLPVMEVIKEQWNEYVDNKNKQDAKTE
jgi:hypothetical protein